jgi:hypothetical protein
MPGDPLGRTDPNRLEVDGSRFVSPEEAANIELYRAARKQQLELRRKKVHAKEMRERFDEDGALEDAEAAEKEAFDKFDTGSKVEIRLRQAEKQQRANARLARMRQMEHERIEANRSKREAREDWEHEVSLYPIRRDIREHQQLAHVYDRAVKRDVETEGYGQQRADAAYVHQQAFWRAQDRAQQRGDIPLPVSMSVFPESVKRVVVDAPDDRDEVDREAYEKEKAWVGQPYYHGEDRGRDIMNGDARRAWMNRVDPDRNDYRGGPPPGQGVRSQRRGLSRPGHEPIQHPFSAGWKKASGEAFRLRPTRARLTSGSERAEPRGRAERAEPRGLRESEKARSATRPPR